MSSALRASDARSPVTPSRPTPYTQPAGPGADAGQALVGPRRRGQQDRLDPGRIRGVGPRRRPPRAAGRGRSPPPRRPRRATRRSARARSGGRCCSRSSRPVGTPPVSRSRSAPTMPWGVAPAASARSDASWIVGPSITGSENGMPTSIGVGAGGGAGLDRPLPAGIARRSRRGRAACARRRGRPAAGPRGARRRWWPAAGRRHRAPPSPTGRRPGGGPPGPRPCRRGPDRLTSTTLPRQRRPLATDPGQGVRRLEGGDDALGAGQQLERGQHLGVGDGLVAGPAQLGQVGVLGADARIVEAGRHRLGLEHLALPRPAGGTTSTRGPRRGCRGRWPRPPAGSAPTSSTPGRSANPEKMPMALDPPPTHATTTSGSPPVSERHCSRASSPMTRCSSRTMNG